MTLRDIRILDTHFHIWDRGLVTLDWILNSSLNKDFSFEEYMQEYDGLRFAGGIYMESDSKNKIQEISFITNLARQKSKMLGFTLGGKIEDYATFTKDIESKKLCGFREVLHTQDSKQRLQSLSFKEGLQHFALTATNPVFECCINAYDLPYLITLVREIPNCIFVLNHFGNPNFYGDLQQYTNDMRILGQYPNVYCKLSSMDNFTDTIDSHIYTTLISIAIESFDSQKVLFGSNFPVSGLRPKIWTNIVFENLQKLGLDSSSIQNIFSNNAFMLYKINPAVQRFAQIIQIKKDKLEEYKKLHANSWLGVNDALKKAHIQNYSIYHHGDRLFAYFEYTGEDFEKDMQHLANDSIMKVWWQHTDTCQIPLEGVENGKMWLDIDEVFHLD